MTDFKEVHDVLRSNGLEDPLMETWKLFEIVSGNAPEGLTDEPLTELGDISLSRVAELRKAGIPLEYIIGSARFGGLLLHCSSSTLIPTEYTTLLVDVTLEFIKKMSNNGNAPTVIEVGTGCGNVAILLARKSNGITIVASDISADALEVARKNIEKYKLDRSVRLVYGDLFEPFRKMGYEGKVDIVICNPPYIPTSSLKKLPPEISVYQPCIALDGGPLGISFFQRIIGGAVSMLKPGGALIFEIGAGQEKFVTWLLGRHGGYSNPGYHKDGDDIIRVMSMQKTGH